MLPLIIIIIIIIIITAAAWNDWILIKLALKLPYPYCKFASSKGS